MAKKQLTIKDVPEEAQEMVLKAIASIIDVFYDKKAIEEKKTTYDKEKSDFRKNNGIV